MSKKLLMVLVFAAAVLLGGSSVMAQSEEAVKSPDLDSEMVEMVDLVPGFGGMFYDEKGRPNVYLTDSSSELRLKAMSPDVIIHRGEYDFRTLQSYRVELRSALSIDGVVALDVDERSNRVRVSINEDMNPKQRAQLQRRLMRMSPDPDAVIIDERPEFLRHQSLRDSVRPVPGGVEIGFPGFLCTLGYNVNGASEFITNSHCTSGQGGVQNTPYTQDAGGGNVGVEIVDPQYNVQPCPFGRRCRRSDSARVRYNNTNIGNQGQIARTVTCNAGGANDRQINGTFRIVGTGNASVGQTITKVGRTSGCRRGTVNQTCADVNVGGTNITLLCQTIVSANGFPLSQGGDSGSPVFIQNGNNATAVGLLWGGNGSGSVMVYSPIGQVINELF